MTTTDARADDASGSVRGTDVDLKFEVTVIPVADVDRAKDFYAGLGWRLDADFAFDNGFRVVQFTPPGSPASVQFGTNITAAAPGSAQGLYLVVSDVAAAREQLAASAPDGASYSSFATFRDPDGNGWLVQEVTTRLPGRVEGATAFASVSDVAGALRRAAAAHGEHEKRTGQYDEQWPDWYAAHIVAEQAGTELPT
jgi:catechol 2,3-dioxygenase-like lactoylglutathione lyase family enzyme